MSIPKIFFNSSLPRSGSTLLQNILAQNPRFYCSPTSGVLDLLITSRNQATSGGEFQAQDRTEMKKAYLGYCRGGLEGFYAALTDRPICVDKGRGWIGFYDLLNAFYPNPKILVCVRDLRAILSSMEKLWRKNRHITDQNEGGGMSLTMASVDSRVIHWLNGPPVGLAAARIVNAAQTGILPKLCIIKFEELTVEPAAVMKKVYHYLEEPYFEHNFEDVRQTTTENDAFFPIYGDHRIRQAVKPVPLDYHDVLGKDISASIKRENPVFYNTIYPEK